MNERQRDLYHFLEELGDEWVTQMDLAYALNNWYDTSRFCNNEDFHNTDARCIMTRDIREINESNEFEKIIISSSKGIKLANEEEFAKYISKLYASVFRRLQRVRTKEKKGKANYNITFDENADFDVVESLLKKFE